MLAILAGGCTSRLWPSSTTVCSISLLSLLCGCSTVTVPQSVLSTPAGGNDPQQQLDYWHTVAAKTLISNDEALHGLLLYLDGKDDQASYDARVPPKVPK